MAPQPMLTQAQVAEMLNVSAKSVENWRLAGKGPAFYRIEGQVRYEIRDVRAWKRQRRHAANQAPKAAGKKAEGE